MQEVNDRLTNTLNDVTDVISANVTIGQKIEISESVAVLPVSCVNAGTMCGIGQNKYKRKQKVQTLNGGMDGGGIALRIKPIGFLIFENGHGRFVSCEKDQKEDGLESVLSAVFTKVTGIKL